MFRQLILIASLLFNNAFAIQCYACTGVYCNSNDIAECPIGNVCYTAIRGNDIHMGCVNTCEEFKRTGHQCWECVRDRCNTPENATLLMEREMRGQSGGIKFNANTGYHIGDGAHFNNAQRGRHGTTATFLSIISSFAVANYLKKF